MLLEVISDKDYIPCWYGPQAQMSPKNRVASGVPMSQNQVPLRLLIVMVCAAAWIGGCEKKDAATNTGFSSSSGSGKAVVAPPAQTPQQLVNSKDGLTSVIMTDYSARCSYSFCLGARVSCFKDVPLTAADHTKDFDDKVSVAVIFNSRGAAGMPFVHAGFINTYAHLGASWIKSNGEARDGYYDPQHCSKAGFN